MASPTRWTWVRANSGAWWWTVKPSMLQSKGLKELDMSELLNWTDHSYGGVVIYFPAIIVTVFGFWREEFSSAEMFWFSISFCSYSSYVSILSDYFQSLWNVLPFPESAITRMCQLGYRFWEAWWVVWFKRETLCWKVISFIAGVLWVVCVFSEFLLLTQSS